MMLARIDVDFIRPARRSPLPGLLVLAIGLVAAYWTVADYRNTAISSELLSMSLTRYQSTTPEVDGAIAGVDTGEVVLATRRLTTPWSLLLSDLEAAATESGKDVALLEVLPDKNKRSLRVSGEARSLTHVLDYVSRLQSAESLMYPLLENHEIQESNRERPVRFVIVANWRLSE
jgi:hypothetical protein